MRWYEDLCSERRGIGQPTGVLIRISWHTDFLSMAQNWGTYRRLLVLYPHNILMISWLISTVWQFCFLCAAYPRIFVGIKSPSIFTYHRFKALCPVFIMGSLWLKSNSLATTTTLGQIQFFCLSESCHTPFFGFIINCYIHLHSPNEPLTNH